MSDCQYCNTIEGCTCSSFVKKVLADRPKPFFTAEDFDRVKFADERELLPVEKGECALVANWKLAPELAKRDAEIAQLKAQWEREFVERGKKLTAAEAENERLRAENESLRIKHGSAMIECTRSLQEIEALRARVAELEANVPETPDTSKARLADLTDEYTLLEAEFEQVEADNTRLREALEPLAAIWDAYQKNGLDEARPEWGGLNYGCVLYSGRGGKTLLTLDDAKKARAALASAGASADGQGEK